MSRLGIHVHCSLRREMYKVGYVPISVVWCFTSPAFLRTWLHTSQRPKRRTNSRRSKDSLCSSCASCISGLHNRAPVTDLSSLQNDSELQAAASCGNGYLARVGLLRLKPSLTECLPSSLQRGYRHDTQVQPQLRAKAVRSPAFAARHLHKNNSDKL